MAERRYTIVFYGSLFIATAATFGVYRVLEANKQRNRIVTRPVVVAARDVADGAALTRRDLREDQWPLQTVPAGAFTSVDSLVNRVTRVRVFKGEPFVPGRLAPVGTAAGLESKIAPGKRAMALRINDVAGISGLIQPDSRVDVVLTLRDARGRMSQQMSKLFLENLRVLSVGSRVDREADGDPIQARTVTVEVTPDEAERLALAQRQGTIQLVLRGFGDPDSVKTHGASSADVLAQLREAEDADKTAARPVARRPRRPAPAAPPPVASRDTVFLPAPLPLPPKPPDSSTVRIIRGTTISSTKVAKDTTKADTSGTRRASSSP
jgi:pilus assembly protein CpaB